MSDGRIETLSSLHSLEPFSSGAPMLDDWLKRRAMTNQSQRLTRTYVLIEGDVVVGYYALAAGSVRREDAISSMRRNAPDPVPVIVLARLAVAQGRQGQGLGRVLMRDAFQRVVQAADLVGVRGILVHAKSVEVRAFYVAVGFEPSRVAAMTLMVTLADLTGA